MAIARVSVKVGKAGKAGPHAEYIARMGKYSGIGQSAPAPVPGFAARRQPEKLEACEVGNMPAWAQHDPSVFWRASDAHERCNGSVYREMEIALPRELTPVQRRDLVRAWVEQELGGRHAYQWAIHVPQALDGGDQPHVHLMFSERQVDGIERDPEQYFRRYNSRSPERGGCRKGFQEVAEVHGPARDAARAGQLQALRERWAVACNNALEQAGRPERIDMRSHAVRGLDTQPERKLRPSEWRDPAVQQKVVDFRQAREACVMSAAHVGSLIPDAGAEIINLEAARQRRAALAKQQQREREQREEAERDRRAKDHADQARWLGLTLSDLRTEAVRIRPVDALRLVDRMPEVASLAQRILAIEEQERQASAGIAARTSEMQTFERLHPRRAWLHRYGLWRDAEAQAIGEQLEDHQRRLDDVSPQLVALRRERATQIQERLPAAEMEHLAMVERHARLLALLQERETQHTKEQADRLAREQAERQARREATQTARHLEIAAGLHQKGQLAGVGNYLHQVLDSYMRMGDTQQKRLDAVVSRMVEHPTLLDATRKVLQPHQEAIAKVEHDRDRSGPRLGR